MTAANLLCPAETAPVVAVAGETRGYPVDRIFRVGRNHAGHAKEMGFEVDREAPWYFTKAANAIVQSGATIAYPPETSNHHHEMELVIAIGAPAFRVSVADAPKAVHGYAAGLAMTRRDPRMAAREKSRPWDLGKAFEQSAVIAAITPGCDHTSGQIRQHWSAVHLDEGGRDRQAGRPPRRSRQERARADQPPVAVPSSETR